MIAERATLTLEDIFYSDTEGDCEPTDVQVLIEWNGRHDTTVHLDCQDGRMISVPYSLWLVVVGFVDDCRRAALTEFADE